MLPVKVNKIVFVKLFYSLANTTYNSYKCNYASVDLSKFSLQNAVISIIDLDRFRESKAKIDMVIFYFKKKT